MQVGVGVLGHVVVEDDVDTLDIHATTEQVGGNQDSLKIKSHQCFIGLTRFRVLQRYKNIGDKFITILVLTKKWHF